MEFMRPDLPDTIWLQAVAALLVATAAFVGAIAPRLSARLRGRSRPKAANDNEAGLRMLPTARLRLV